MLGLPLAETREVIRTKFAVEIALLAVSTFVCSESSLDLRSGISVVRVITTNKWL